MKLACFDDFRIAVVSGEQLFDVTDCLPRALEMFPQQRMRWLIANWSDAIRRELQTATASANGRPLAEAGLLTPVPDAPHVFAAPANYQKHVGELKDRAVTKKGRSAREQGFFLKAPGSLIGAGQAICLPRGSVRRFDHESELAIIIGKGGRNIPRADALQHVFGYSCLIDLTMRIEPGSGEEERSMRKSFATFTPVGPFIVTQDEVGDAGKLQNRLFVNGELRQSANTAELIVGIEELIELISSVLPLQPGDIIASGTPEGVGPVVPGDLVKISIEQVGEMALPVVEANTVAPRAY